ncbi:hypothetical protein G6F63_015876 [Rhizopus arrhizus]|nr:hypothetical protein G6F63_015876 [Rhizopus arrhizus]
MRLDLDLPAVEQRVVHRAADQPARLLVLGRRQARAQGHGVSGQQIVVDRLGVVGRERGRQGGVVQAGGHVQHPAQGAAAFGQGQGICRQLGQDERRR